jgi:hypothetical protein
MITLQTSASKAQNGLHGYRTWRRRPRADYARYDASKAIWVASHPAATPAEYEAAMRSIAKACGV